MNILSLINKNKISIGLLKVIGVLFYVGLPYSEVKSQAKGETRIDYHHLFKIEKNTYNSQDLIFTSVKALPDTSSFTSFINNNVSYFSYLLTNFSSIQLDSFKDIQDSVCLQQKFISALQNDTLFNNVMSDFNFSEDQTISADTVDIHELLQIAVKFFTITEVDEQGIYKGKVCGGKNLLGNTEAHRKPHLEAFCFSSILKHYKSETFSMYDEFVKALQQIYSINFGIVPEENLLRAQGAMFFIMRENAQLKEMLIHRYDENKANLPFVLNDV